MFASSHELLFLVAALPPAALAAATDLRERKIPNRLTGATFCAGLALHAGLEGWSGLLGATLAALAAGSCFLLFYLAGGMGAGDVKLMAALGAIVGLPALPITMLNTALVGGVAALALAVYHRRFFETLSNVLALVTHHRREGLRPHPELHVRNENALRLPFAVPIALGCCASVLCRAWSKPW